MGGKRKNFLDAFYFPSPGGKGGNSSLLVRGKERGEGK
jgi:hypothetical protein